MITINIANEYTKTPGGRFKSEGDFSGEDFRDSILIPKYLEAVKQNQLLCIKFGWWIWIWIVIFGRSIWWVGEKK